MTFAIDPILQGPSLTLAPLQATDEAALTRAAADPEIWAQHPAHDRADPAVFAPYFAFLLAASGTLAVRETETNTVIGCSRFYPVPNEPDAWGVGFTFLARSNWGGTTNREMKALMVAHVLRHRPEVWFHIAPNNLRSQIATTRLGAQFRYDADLELAGTGPSPNKCYSLTAESWHAATGTSLDL